MTVTHATATRDEWRAARLKLLADEKALTRQMDAIARRRQELPWVRVEKPYRFDTEAGPATLADLFGEHEQLIVYHFMFGPDYTAGCPSCSSIADGFDGIVESLARHDVALWAVSSGPLDRLLAYRELKGWSFPWASSAPSDFNGDFGVSFTREQQAEGIEYNWTREPPAAEAGEPPAGVLRLAAATGTDGPAYVRERPGVSAFIREDGEIYHTYSAYSRGVDGIWGMYQWLDRAPLGRNE